MDLAAVMPAWHDLLHVLTAAVFVLTGLPVLVLSLRAWSRLPRRPLHQTTGPTRATGYAVAATVAIGAAVVLLMAAARSTALSDAVVASTGTAVAGAIAMHAMRRASFSGLSAVPLVGLLGMATLLAVAGAQPQTASAHDSAPQGSTAPHTHGAATHQ